MARFVATDLPLAPTLRAEMLAPFLIASPPALGPALIEVSARWGFSTSRYCANCSLTPSFVYVRRDIGDTLLTAAAQTYQAPEIAPHLLKPAESQRLLERFE